MIINSMIMPAGFILDCIFGDPYDSWHPVKLIGELTSFFEKKLNKPGGKKLKLKGIFMVAVVIAVSVMSVYIISGLIYSLNIYAGFIFESYIIYKLLAARSLRDESMKVYHALAEKDIIKARHAVSMIVGRDTDVLDEKGITKAAVETVAENTSDGVIAPLFYIALFGAAGGLFYKAVNTMDSMVGYKDERYRSFGWAAARLDDVVNYIPSRLSAMFMILSSCITGQNVRGAVRIYLRDRKKHASPNSAQTESVCAGALSLQLAGDAYYFGKLYKKPYIGDDIRDPEPEDIKRADRMMYVSSLIAVLVFTLIRAACYMLFRS